MIIKKLALQAATGVLVAFYGVLLTVAHAENAVLGQLFPETSITLNPGAGTSHVFNSETPYLSGDVVSTLGSKGATLISNTGDVVTLSEDSKIAVDAISPLSVTLLEGAFKFTSNAGATTSIDTPSGTFRVTADNTASGIAIYQNGEFAIKSLAGSFTVENDSDSAVAKIDQQTAFMHADGQPRTVDVLEGENGILIALLAAAAVIAGIIIISDDNTPTSP